MARPDALDKALETLEADLQAKREYLTRVIGSSVGPVHIQEMNDAEIQAVVAQLESLPEFVEITFHGGVEDGE